MRARLGRLTVLVLLALPAALALGALVAWAAWPASSSTAASSTPTAATARASSADRRLIRSERAGAASPRAAAPTGAVAVRSARRAANPARASTPERVQALAADVSFTLCAKAGTTTLPDSTVVNIWGFALGDCGVAGPATLPGPMLDVNVGQVVEITLDNSLAQNVALAFPGQSLVPDDVGDATGGGTKSYTFTVARPGTFLYEAGGPNAPRQVAMGLHGAMLVRSANAGQAYGTPESAYDTEAVLVLSEIDPALNANPTGFAMNTYGPKYWLINGRAYDETPDPPDTMEIPALEGQRLLLRYVNAAISHHTMELLGLHQRVIAKDAYPTAFPFDLISETFPSGATGDMIVTIPVGDPAGSLEGTQFPLYSRSLYLTNGPTFPGGMLRFVKVVAPGP